MCAAISQRWSITERRQSIASDLYSQGCTLAEEKKWEQAIALYNRALPTQRKILGMDHPDVARTLNALGVALTKVDEKYGAMTALEEALWIRQKVLGAGHKDVAETTNNLWMLLEETRVGMEQSTIDTSCQQECKKSAAYQPIGMNIDSNQKSDFLARTA